MYAFFVKQKIAQAFAHVNARDFAPVLAGVSPTVIHTFAGSHALSGTRTTRAALGAWFERLVKVFPNLKIHIDDCIIAGHPAKTRATVLWHVTATLLDGSAYTNQGVYVIDIRWGTISRMQAFEDTQLIADALLVQARHGIADATASPITA